MSETESGVGAKEFRVEGTPERIVSMIHGYLESDEWPHKEQSQVFKALITGSNKLTCKVDYGYNPWGCVVWLLLFIVTLGAAILAWLAWILWLRDDYVPAVYVGAYPESTSLSRVTLSSKRKPEYLEPIAEWIQRELVEKRRAADSLLEQRGSSKDDDIPAQIRKLGELRDAGVLTEDEFERKKSELLDRM